MLKENEIFEKMNRLGNERKPFVFIIDFLKLNGIVLPLNELNDEIQFEINGKQVAFDGKIDLTKYPVPLEIYRSQFEQAQSAFKSENIDLINLTCETPIEINLNLDEIYKYSNAKYKLLLKDQFVCFSPETFVKIQDGMICSYPMKGTIDASIDDAKHLILNHPKEIEEHQLTVDWVKDELSRVAENVEVKKFRYIDEIKTHDKTLLQVSSEVCGKLPSDFHSNLGSIFDQLLPASSICGAPKEKAFELIKSVEKYERGFYTGIFGIYDGNDVDSAVLIRFIEKKSDQLVFKSGGGITAKSDLNNEYNELMSKIYVPIN